MEINFKFIDDDPDEGLFFTDMLSRESKVKEMEEVLISSGVVEEKGSRTGKELIAWKIEVLASLFLKAIPTSKVIIGDVYSSLIKQASRDPITLDSLKKCNQIVIDTWRHDPTIIKEALDNVCKPAKEEKDIFSLYGIKEEDAAEIRNSQLVVDNLNRTFSNYQLSNEWKLLSNKAKAAKIVAQRKLVKDSSTPLVRILSLSVEYFNNAEKFRYEEGLKKQKTDSDRENYRRAFLDGLISKEVAKYYDLKEKYKPKEERPL